MFFSFETMRSVVISILNRMPFLERYLSLTYREYHSYATWFLWRVCCLILTKCEFMVIIKPKSLMTSILTTSNLITSLRKSMKLSDVCSSDFKILYFQIPSRHKDKMCQQIPQASSCCCRSLTGLWPSCSSTEHVSSCHGSCR